MPRHYDDDDDEDLRPSRPDFQLEIGTRGVLGLFGALAVLCGLFFSFGYTVGKHSAPTSFSLGDNNSVAAETTPANKSAAGTPIQTATPQVSQPPNPSDLTAAEVNQTPQTLVPGPSANAPATPDPAASGNSATAASPTTPATPPAQSPVRPAALTAAAPVSATPANGYAVQVFAGTRQGDALSLAAALKSRQYPVFILNPAAGGDGLYRVQVGPYNSLGEAQQMREHLAADGYNAVIK